MLRNKKLLKIILLFTIIIILLIGGFILYKIISNQQDKISELETDYQEAQTTIDSYGTLVPIYVVQEEILSGSILDTSKVKEIEVPSSQVTEQYITDLKTIENYIVKTDLKVGTPLIKDVLTFENITPTDRYEDIVVDTFPIEPRIGQYYDVHLVTPQGIDYLVLSKKRVVNFYGTAMRAVLNEVERMRYNSALVDTFLNEGSYLYTDIYVEPSLQEKATPWYVATDNVRKANQQNPNLAQEVKKALLEENRETFNNSLKVSEEQLKSIVAGRKAQLSSIKNATTPQTEKEKEAVAEEGTNIEDTSDSYSSTLFER